MASANTSYDYVVSMCEASAALRTENVQLRQERDEARAERDQLTLRLAKITAELTSAKEEGDELRDGLSSLLRDANSSRGKRNQELIEDVESMGSKRARITPRSDLQYLPRTGAMVFSREQEEGQDGRSAKSEEEHDPVQQWIDMQDRIHRTSTISIHESEVQQLRSMFLTTWPENSPQETKFLDLLNWVFPEHCDIQDMITTFDQYACWSFGRRTGESGPCPWARHANRTFSCRIERNRSRIRSDCGYCHRTGTHPLSLCMWLCHANVDTGYPERDSSGIIRKRDNVRKVADKKDWRVPERLTEERNGKRIRWIVHLYS